MNCMYFVNESNINLNVHSMLLGSKDVDIEEHLKLFEIVQNFIESSGTFN